MKGERIMKEMHTYIDITTSNFDLVSKEEVLLAWKVACQNGDECTLPEYAECLFSDAEGPLFYTKVSEHGKHEKLYLIPFKGIVPESMLPEDDSTKEEEPIYIGTHADLVPFLW